jgi:hypothetical protein
MTNLTTEQKQTLNETIRTMQASCATREQTMNAVNELLKQWGIEIPPQTETPPPPTPLTLNNTTGTPPPQPRASNVTADTPPPSPPWMGNLTAEQKQTLEETVKTMKSSGATPEQIRSAVDELLRQWGIAIPRCA